MRYLDIPNPRSGNSVVDLFYVIVFAEGKVVVLRETEFECVDTTHGGELMEILHVLKAGGGGKSVGGRNVFVEAEGI